MYERGRVLAWQASLIGDDEIDFDSTFDGLERRALADGAWIDQVTGWVSGADELFAQLLDQTPWPNATSGCTSAGSPSRG